MLNLGVPEHTEIISNNDTNMNMQLRDSMARKCF